MNPTGRPKHIMVIAGEPSGDDHGSTLVRSILNRDPHIVFSGIGGDKMKAHGVELFFHIRHLSVMGLWEVILQLANIRRAFILLQERLVSKRPDLLILIDYPGFNLRAAAVAKRMGIPVLYYISPKIWAWKPSRIKTIKRCVDHMALIFPFEVPLYRKAAIPCTFVGNPLLDLYPDAMAPKPRDGHNGWIIGLLPGSRETEIDRLLDTLLQSAVILKKRMGNIKFLVSAASSVDRKTIETSVARFRDQATFTIVQGDLRRIFTRADMLIAASGTATLEAALCCIPMVIVYRMAGITYFLARLAVRVQYVGLANIIAGEKLVPELLQKNVSPKIIADTVEPMLHTRELLKTRSRLALVRKLLGSPGAADRTATLALSMVRQFSR
ncbi:MAG: lipid-A-disaccharide synthase [Pseudomonadota bacterium]